MCVTGCCVPWIVRVTDLVNDNGRRFEWVVDGLQTGIELFDEGEVRRPIGDEPRYTRKIELWAPAAPVHAKAV